MKTLLTLVAGLFLSTSLSVAQTPLHPVIEKMQVSYKAFPGAPGSATPTATPEIKVKGTANIVLKTGFDAVKIYMKVIDKQSHAVVYQVNYMIASSDVVDQGTTLYRRQGNTVYITNPSVITLKPYLYELYTEDANGNQSSVYTIIQ